MKLRSLVSKLAAVGLGLVLASGAASAAVSWFTPITVFEDDNLDYVFDNDDDGKISIGDRFISVLEFNNSQGILPNQGPDSFLPGELTGIADVTIVDIVAGAFIFRATNELAPGAGLLGAFAAGTAVAAWYQEPGNLNVINSSCGTQAQCIALASDGNLFLTAGFFGDLDDFWIAAALGGGDDIATVQTGAAATKYGTVNFGLTIGVNNTGYDFGLQDCTSILACGSGDGFVQMIGSADILGGQGLTPSEWTARSDTDVQLVPIRVPEPGSLALVGLALAGLGAMRRRAN